MLRQPASNGSNPAQTDLSVLESMSVFMRKVGGLSLNTLYNASGFFPSANKNWKPSYNWKKAECFGKRPKIYIFMIHVMMSE
jgi:hypothetical protein